MIDNDKHKGSVIIIVLWTVALLTVLVTAMAGKVRLSAKTAVNNQSAAMNWLAVMTGVNHGEMELILERMPRPIGELIEETEEGEIRNPAYRFNGQKLELNYPLHESVTVRIYDHAGKISLNRIPRRNMQLLIEKKLGGQDADPQEVQELLGAWTDWTDLNDLEGLNGAEKDYYESLENGYVPRNNPELDTVEEILHIRGFSELFRGVNLQAAFTVYGNTRTVNLNLATREAMELLPGLNNELIENIIAYRQIEDISNRAEIAEIVPFEELQELSPWVGSATTNFFSIYSYLDEEIDYESPFVEDPQSSETESSGSRMMRQAYMEIIEVNSINELPKVLQIDPYGQLPDFAPAKILEEDYLF
ncbi:MAG: type II secretion system protein GspK [Gammaproteobacteria bacterium]|nr:type II secretion system protein GspK [Gammaproteobacteria bacterium]